MCEKVGSKMICAVENTMTNGPPLELEKDNPKNYSLVDDFCLRYFCIS